MLISNKRILIIALFLIVIPFSVLGEPVQNNNFILHQGWNMIGSPISEGISLDYLRQNCDKINSQGDQMLAWDASTQEFKTVSTILPYTGTLIRSDGDCNIPLPSGTPISSPDKIEIKAGWNMISFDGNLLDYLGTCAAQISDAKVLGPDNQPTIDLNSINSYWLWVADDCELKKGASTPSIATEDNAKITFVQGWNIINVPAASSVPISFGTMIM